VKARRVKGIDPDGPLDENVRRIIAVRLDELCSFMPKAEDPTKQRTLHDMRIAAKRLRYLLELFAPQFGPYAATAGKKVKHLQDLLGEIHDCDVTLPRVEALIDELRAHDVEAVRGRAGDADDLDPALVATAPNGASYRGLEAMVVFLRARRALLFQRFLELWLDLQRSGLRPRLEYALAERPQAPGTTTAGSPADNGRAAADRLPSVESS
jgi:hypothetical protein